MVEETASLCVALLILLLGTSFSGAIKSAMNPRYFQTKFSGSFSRLPFGFALEQGKYRMPNK